MKRRTWTIRERNLVLKHYGLLAPQPLPVKEIAQLCNRSCQQVRSYAKFLKIVRREYNYANDKKLSFYYNRGMSDTQISLMIGCSRQTVLRWRKGNNLIANKKSWGHKR